MSVAGFYRYDSGKRAGMLYQEFGSSPRDKLAEDSEKTESAVRRLVIMKERWDRLPRTIRVQLAPIEWPAVTGTWERNAGRHVGVDTKELWETVIEKLPEMSRKTEELLKSQS